MPKLPAMLFYTGDWLKDPAVSFCSPATRGVWMDLLCAMHESNRSGQLRGTADQLARIARCSTVELDHALTELQTTGAADVTDRNGNVTVKCRRMEREYQQRVSTRKRVAKHRCNENVTRPSSSSSSSSRDKPPLTPPPGGNETGPPAAPPKPPPENPLQDREPIAWTAESGWSGVTQADRQRWASAYPACDIDRQLAAMDAWCRANPARAHKSNWARFVVNWLKREQDRGGDARGGNGAAPSRVRRVYLPPEPAEQGAAHGS